MEKLMVFKLFKVDILLDCVHFSLDKVDSSDSFDFCTKNCSGTPAVDRDFSENIGE